MEEQKYYTPAPEDIRVGFECEVQVDFDAWEHAKVSAESKVFEIAMVLIETNGIRVPYLTAEQIENEGWTVDEDFPAHDGQILPFILNFENDQTSWYYHLWHNPDDNGMEITRYQGSDMQTLFHGSCRCINDFKAIIRLCNII